MSLTPYHRDDLVTLYHGDCIEVMRALPDSSVDAVVTDPPYEIGFMGKGWDGQGIAYSTEMWSEVLRVLKPGGHLISFGGCRTWHRMAVAIEDSGFQIRENIAWLFASGFPKSLDVSKAIDKAAGATREVVGVDPRYVGMSDKAKRALGSVVHDGTGGTGFSGDPSLITAPATPEAARWQGWGTAMKPAHEPIVVARKPLIGTVAANVLAHGTGALNVDGCRIAGDVPQVTQGLSSAPSSWDHRTEPRQSQPHDAGRWPANVILDESQARALDAMSGVLHSQDPATRSARRGTSHFGSVAADDTSSNAYGDTGGASRFFYTAKADSSERPRVDGVAHPTVKPLDLMRYLVRLVTPPGGVVLEPFAGSGTTLEACIVEDFSCIGIEREADYIPLIMQRITKPIEVTLL